MSELIFEKSCKGRKATSNIPKAEIAIDIAAKHLRTDELMLPEVSELDVVRHFTKLSQKKFLH